MNSIIHSDILISQPEKGFRFSVDSIYLAWFIRYKKSAKVLEVGAGSGVISTLLARKKSFENITAVELQNEMYEYLTATISQNNLEDIVTPVMSDINSFSPKNIIDIIVSNPPYRSPETGRVPKNTTELNARFTTTLCAENIFEFGKKYLKNSGSIYLSYDADLMQDLFDAALKYGFEAKRLMPVCPDINVRPKIILMEFRKNTGREMIFEAPLYQKINGEQSEQDRKIMTGEWDV